MSTGDARLRTRKWKTTRLRVLQRDGGVCGICGLAGATSVDHVVPRARGGDDADANLRAAHISCNSRAGARLRAKVRPGRSRSW